MCRQVSGRVLSVDRRQMGFSLIFSVERMHAGFSLSIEFWEDAGGLQLNYCVLIGCRRAVDWVLSLSVERSHAYFSLSSECWESEGELQLGIKVFFSVERRQTAAAWGLRGVRRAAAWVLTLRLMITTLLSTSLIVISKTVWFKVWAGTKSSIGKVNTLNQLSIFTIMSICKSMHTLTMRHKIHQNYGNFGPTGLQTQPL